ncbi:MBL fold metallo-hydrolase [Marinococcus halophilus]|uniref:MBL fold hydrolase n=1 Tax=Marinococcus halophilus TaxID=1371 RepID=A0A510Y6N6_MARHA|nr:MBL fold metallo-hydrolase [Marinococcus halophilus]OZT80655.1 MBL fold metallo-hydrolase [Marinococcus halophilus]GEK59014.1 MBL fold hydrolase [Marinococcus halophilus]
MTLQFSVLASGSTGNAIYVQTGKQRLLIDAGLSGKKIVENLCAIGVDPAALDALIITHEHSDHIKSAGVLSRKYQLPVYANPKTWQAMEGLIGKVPLEQKFHLERNQPALFGNIELEPFHVSHDAVDPMFFVFHNEGKKLALATDMGYVSDQIKGTVKNADAYIFESNHDINLLRMGHYPWNVKKRILGDSGHVSNEDSAYALADVVGDRTSRIYLAHLSRDNNMKDLARMTVQQVLEEEETGIGHTFHLYDTDPFVPTSLHTL